MEEGVGEYNDEAGPLPFAGKELDSQKRAEFNSPPRRDRYPVRPDSAYIRLLNKNKKLLDDNDCLKSELSKLKEGHENLDSQLKSTNNQIDGLLKKQKSHGRQFVLLTVGVFVLIFSIMISGFRITGLSTMDVESTGQGIINIFVFILALAFILVSLYWRKCFHKIKEQIDPK